MRVSGPLSEDLYLALRRVSVADLAVFVQYPAPDAHQSQAQPIPMTALTATDMRDGKLLVRRPPSDAGDVLVWVRISGEGLRWFELDVLSQSDLAQQTNVGWAITAVELTFSLLLLLACAAQYANTRTRIYALMMGLACIAGLSQLQWSGLLLNVTGQSAETFIRLNAAAALALACAMIYASAQVLIPAVFAQRQGRWMQSLLGLSLFFGAIAYGSTRNVYAMTGMGFALLALGIFLWQCAKHWLAQPS